MSAKQRYFENEGALFRGPTRAYPEEVWSAKDKAWFKYDGKVPKGIEFGEYLTEEEATEAYMTEKAGA